MIIRELRQERDWSQEQLAELSGLSLRTIQRLEGINKVSTETVQALAATFDMDVVALEQEMAMEKTSGTWKKRPAWVRGLFFGSGRIQMDRQQHRKVELLSIIFGIFFVASGALAELGILVPAKTAAMLLICGSLLILGAYLMSISVRVANRYSVWPWIETDPD